MCISRNENLSRPYSPVVSTSLHVTLYAHSEISSLRQASCYYLLPFRWLRYLAPTCFFDVLVGLMEDELEGLLGLEVTASQEVLSGLEKESSNELVEVLAAVWLECADDVGG